MLNGLCGYYPTAPDSVRTLFGVIGGAAMLLALLVAFGLSTWLFELTPAAICPGSASLWWRWPSSLPRRAMPRKTEMGAVAAACWKGFKEYLRNIDRDADLEAQKALWDRWLPYAIRVWRDKEPSVNLKGPAPRLPAGIFPRPISTAPIVGATLAVACPGEAKEGTTKEGAPLGGAWRSFCGMGGGLASMSAGLGALLSSTQQHVDQPASSSGGLERRGRGRRRRRRRRRGGFG
jgi:hypothetical protein